MIDHHVPLPTSCPIQTGKLTPGIVRACCFAPSFFRELVDDGTLCVEKGCPLIQCCGLYSLWPRKVNDDRFSTQF